MSSINEKSRLINEKVKSASKTRFISIGLITIVCFLGLQLYQFKNQVFFYQSILAGPPLQRTDPYRALQQIESDDPLFDNIGIPTLNPSNEHLHIGSKAMISSDVPLCSTMGKNILLQGGNAADAAVTVALCIGSVNSHSSGIGGGSFILSKNGKDLKSIDAREMAPQAAFQSMYDANPLLSKIGGLAIGIPGELAGLYELFKLHGSGKLSWKELFEPVIKLNREGFVCSKIFATAVLKEHEMILSRIPSLRKQWDFIYEAEDKLVQEGDIIKRLNYADTLELIANNGSSAIFYDPDGPIVESLVRTIQEFGGVFKKEDFSNYEVIVETPINTTINVGNERYDVFSSGGVSCGLALTAGLNFFDEVFNNASVDENNIDQLLYNHKVIESFKWLASIRSEFGDVNETYKQALIDKYGGGNRTWIKDILENKEYSDNQTFPWKHYKPKYALVEHQGTAHFNILDENNNAVSMTTTVNFYFGSLVYDSKTGIVLNNEMDDFSVGTESNGFNLTPSIFNFVASLKRPLSSTSPTMVLDSQGQVDLIIGSAGGSRITTAVLQAIIRLYYEKLDLLDTISYPRFHHQLIPEYIMVENLTMFNEEYPTNVEGQMKNLGHDFYVSGALTAMNAIKRNSITNQIEGVSDYWRKRGEADGY
ncbi:gamma-glutamyltransferase [Scheffersomyces amazonensis]|uniref:gamma-glutamyltransferase n=1 Tax=Scheffersomyces amazonensis TaxID=1078765 RepID=UPI00315CEFB9